MDPASWRAMVDASRQLELALGDGIKVVENNEHTTFQLQRRALRASRDINIGEILTSDDVVSLRPCPPNGLKPTLLEDILGLKTDSFIAEGDLIPHTLIQ